MAKKKTNKIPHQHAEENLFMQLITRYLSYWPLFIILLLTFGVGAYVFVLYSTPKYEASASILIKDEKKGAEDTKAMEQLDVINTKKIIENEIGVLQSGTLMEAVVDSLHLYAQTYQDGKIRVISGYKIAPVAVIAENPDSIKPVNKVFFDYDPNSFTVTIDGKQKAVIDEWVSTPYGTLKFIINKRYQPISSNKPFFFKLTTPRDAVKIFSRGLQVFSENKMSSIVNLSYRDEVPERAEDILQKLVDSYITASKEEKNLLAKNTLNFVQERLAIVKHELDSIGQKVQSYKTGTGSSDISTQGQLYLQSVTQGDQELSKINMDLAVLDQVQQSVNSSGGSGASMMPSTMGVADNNLTKLMTDLNNKELEYENKRKTTAENHPSMLALKDQINKIKPEISANLQSQRSNLLASKSKLSENIGKYNSMLSTLPQKERDILEMSRDLKTKQDNYDFLINKMFESKNSIENTLSDVKVVNRAEATKYPVSPNKMFIYLGAIAAAFVFGFLIITAKEGFSRNILYRKDLETMTEVPVLGEIAFKKGKKERLVNPGERSFIAEEFRKIRVALHFLGINEENKKILITSSIPGEGKSFIAANLAISNALAGKKVVLVDADLHKPGLGKIFGKSTEDPGLSDYLTGHTRTNEILTQVTGYPNLFYVSSGTLHDSPSELLLNKKIETFVNELDHQFDLVIIDTAPSVLITDAYVLSALVDATLYVVRHKHTPKLVIKRLDENLEINELKNPAIIFNGVRKRGFVKNNYG